MSIQPVGAVTGTFPTPAVAPGVGVQPTGAAAGTAAPFSLDVVGALENLQAMQSHSSALGLRAVTGDLDDVHDYTIASAQSSLALELTAALRNKAVEAFTEIMRMQA
jgi:flagellar hook-basal body complex protein FliE